MARKRRLASTASIDGRLPRFERVTWDFGRPDGAAVATPQSVDLAARHLQFRPKGRTNELLTQDGIARPQSAAALCHRPRRNLGFSSVYSAKDSEVAADDVDGAGMKATRLLVLGAYSLPHQSIQEQHAQVKWALRALLPCRARPGSFSPEEHTVRRQAQHSGEISGVSRHTSAAANVIPLAGQTPPRVAVRHFIQTIVGERRSRADLPRLEPDPCPTPQMHYLSGGRGCATG
jgi:hypothetical protein